MREAVELFGRVVSAFEAEYLGLLWDTDLVVAEARRQVHCLSGKVEGQAIARLVDQITDLFGHVHNPVVGMSLHGHSELLELGLDHPDL